MAAAWREALERNALWVSLGALAAAGLVVAVGVQVAPESFYDRFWWEDIWGPLVVDAKQCKTDVGCPGVVAPGGVRAKDGYTVTSELTYGAVLATMLYGIYVGLFRKFRIVADGRFVLALLPWIMLGPLARVLEDADVFCQAGTHCEPGPFAYAFISPVIYVHIALYVIAGMLLGVWIERSTLTPERRTAIVGGVVGAGFAAYAALTLLRPHWWSALPPLWWIALVVVASVALFHRRAKRGAATMNLTVFVLGVPFVAWCAWLIARWLVGGVWSPEAWSGAYYREAGLFILAVAASAALVVRLLAKLLVRSGVEGKWALAASHVPDAWGRRFGWAGLLALAIALLTAGVLPVLQPLFESVPSKEVLIPALGLGGLALLVAYAFVQVGRGAAAKPGVLLLFAAGINVALVFGHVMDGVATWVALEDPVGFGIPQYAEKHPLSEFLLRYWGGFFFPATKLTMVLVVAWVLDRETKPDPSGETDSWGERNLAGLVKMAIFVLGFAPGLRDLLRLAMGV